MPGRNGMGPMGQGPMTGGGRGWCSGAAARAEFPQRGAGFGMGRGNGRGGGWRHRNWFYTTGLTGWQRAETQTMVDPKEEDRASLTQRAEALRRELADIENRLRAESGVEGPEAP